MLVFRVYHNFNWLNSARHVVWLLSCTICKTSFQSFENSNLARKLPGLSQDAQGVLIVLTKIYQTSCGQNTNPVQKVHSWGTGTLEIHHWPQAIAKDSANLMSSLCQSHFEMRHAHRKLLDNWHSYVWNAFYSSHIWFYLWSRKILQEKSDLILCETAWPSLSVPANHMAVHQGYSNVMSWPCLLVNWISPAVWADSRWPNAIPWFLCD